VRTLARLVLQHLVPNKQLGVSRRLSSLLLASSLGCKRFGGKTWRFSFFQINDEHQDGATERVYIALHFGIGHLHRMKTSSRLRQIWFVLLYSALVLMIKAVSRFQT
jgi:hypothetical protein